MFRFALQPLFDARVRAEDEARGALAAAAAAAADARARAVAAQAAFADAGRDFAARAAAAHALNVRASMARLALLADAARYAQADALRCSERETLARESFAAARFERRRIDVLRANAHARYRCTAARVEGDRIDEANAARHNLATPVAPSLHN